MTITSKFWNLVRRHRKIAAIILLLGASYFTSWHYRRELGFIHPMANMVYYYYGAKPNAFSDRTLYWFYYPVYRFGDKHGIHWSDRSDPYDPFDF